MTGTLLLQIGNIKREITMWEDKLRELERGRKADGEAEPACRGAIRDKVYSLRRRSEELYLQALDFVSEIEDSELRQIVTLYYLEGKTWQQVAFRIGHYDEQYPRKRAQRYLRKLQTGGVLPS